MKQSYLVPTVTTEKSLVNCIINRYPVFSVEQPLYSEMRGFHCAEGYNDYILYRFSRYECIIFTRVRGGGEVSIAKYKVIYPRIGQISMFGYRILVFLVRVSIRLLADEPLIKS